GRRRQVPLNEAADAVLARRGPKNDGLVFGSSNWDRYRTAWERAVKRAKLPDLHWHDLRVRKLGGAAPGVAVRAEGVAGPLDTDDGQAIRPPRPEHLRAAAAALDGVLAPTRSHRRARPTQQARSPQQGDSKLMVAVGYPPICP